MSGYKARGKRFKPRIPRDELLQLTKEELAKKGAEHNSQAKLLNALSHEVYGNRKPLFAQLQARPTVRDNEAWSRVYSLVYNYLRDNKMCFTLESFELEMSDVRTLKHNKNVDGEDAFDEILGHIPKKKENFKRRVSLWKKQDEKGHPQAHTKTSQNTRDSEKNANSDVTDTTSENNVESKSVINSVSESLNNVGNNVVEMLDNNLENESVVSSDDKTQTSGREINKHNDMNDSQAEEESEIPLFKARSRNLKQEIIKGNNASKDNEHVAKNTRKKSLTSLDKENNSFNNANSSNSKTSLFMTSSKMESAPEYYSQVSEVEDNKKANQIDAIPDESVHFFIDESNSPTKDYLGDQQKQNSAVNAQSNNVDLFVSQHMSDNDAFQIDDIPEEEDINGRINDNDVETSQEGDVFAADNDFQFELDDVSNENTPKKEISQSTQFKTQIQTDSIEPGQLVEESIEDNEFEFDMPISEASSPMKTLPINIPTNQPNADDFQIDFDEASSPQKKQEQNISSDTPQQTLLADAEFQITDDDMPEAPGNHDSHREGLVGSITQGISNPNGFDAVEDSDIDIDIADISSDSENVETNDTISAPVPHMEENMKNSFHEAEMQDDVIDVDDLEDINLEIDFDD